MTDAAISAETDAQEGGMLRVYEVGYHIIPTVKEEDLESIVGGIRTTIGKSGGSLIAEGAPALMRLSYPMSVRAGEKYIEHDRGHFGWLKFEASAETAHAIDDILRKNAEILRHLLFRTVREDTRAKFRAPQLREVKRTDTLKTTARRAQEPSGPVSEEELEKALQDITVE